MQPTSAVTKTAGCRSAASAAMLVIALSTTTSATAEAQNDACKPAVTGVSGVVRRLGGPAVGGATITFAWNEVLANGLMIARVRCSRSVTSAADGTFRGQGVPADVSALVTAEGSDGAVGVVVRSALANALPLTVWMPTADDARAGQRPDHAKPGCTTRGIVLNADGEPVKNATVNVGGSDLTRTDDNGRFNSDQCDEDGGSFLIRGLDVTRGDFYVALAAPAAAWVISLERQRPQLEEVVVRATSTRSRDATGFDERRANARGRFITRAEIADRQPPQLTWMFEGLPGVRVMRDKTQGDVIMMGRSSGSGCQPSIIVDNVMVNMGNQLLQSMSPDNVYGIEIYRGPSETPIQFQQGHSGCGVIVIWTRRSGMSSGE